MVILVVWHCCDDPHVLAFLGFDPLYWRHDVVLFSKRAPDSDFSVTFPLTPPPDTLLASAARPREKHPCARSGNSQAWIPASNFSLRSLGQDAVGRLSRWTKASLNSLLLSPVPGTFWMDIRPQTTPSPCLHSDSLIRPRISLLTYGKSLCPSLHPLRPKDLLSPVSVVASAVRFVQISMCRMQNRWDRFDMWMYTCLCVFRWLSRRLHDDVVWCLAWSHSDVDLLSFWYISCCCNLMGCEPQGQFVGTCVRACVCSVYTLSASVFICLFMFALLSHFASCVCVCTSVCVWLVEVDEKPSVWLGNHCGRRSVYTSFWLGRCVKHTSTSGLTNTRTLTLLWSVPLHTIHYCKAPL